MNDDGLTQEEYEKWLEGMSAWIDPQNPPSLADVNKYVVTDDSDDNTKTTQPPQPIEHVDSVEEIDIKLSEISKKMLPSLGILEKKRLEKAYDALLDQRSILTSL